MKRIEVARLAKQQGLTFTSWAEKAYVSTMTLRRWKNGGRVKVETLKQICDAVSGVNWMDVFLQGKTGKKA